MRRWPFAVLLACPASASAMDPWWSAGGHMGTRFVPNAYPAAFPPRIDTYDFDGDGANRADDVDGDKKPDETTLQAVRGDFHAGVEAHRWVAGTARLGIAA